MLKTLLFLSLVGITALAGTEHEMRVGVAGHAFDHLGGFPDQADAAAASGATIIYGTGFGSLGYSGLPTEAELKTTHESVSAYLRGAKQKGIRLAIGYVCATSIVKLETFDKNWSAQFRAQFSTPPAQWLQQDKDGHPLPSWYGGDYRPACMNNPDWLRYEKFIVRQQIEAGYDGIFFDNPTVHPQGCYCDFCMKKFAQYLNGHSAAKKSDAAPSRSLATSHPKEFLQFRCTTARDFMQEIRTFARKIKREALITCNNSLNSPDVFFSQCRDYGYNIYEMSKTEDFIAAEDMGSQPRILGNGNTVEYGNVYEMLHAISHGKPVVAVTIAEADYHTAPNLVRLAMAEAAAHRASYLSWPTWPEAERERMSSAIRPQADLLRAQEKILNDTRPRVDAVVFLPFRRWVETTDCAALKITLALTRTNVQFVVACEENLAQRLGKNALGRRPVLVIESENVLTADERKLVSDFRTATGTVIIANTTNWLQQLDKAIDKPSVDVHGSPNVRAVVADQEHKTIVHIFNLDVQRVSSFEDKVTSAKDISLDIRTPFSKVHSIEVLSADMVAEREIEFMPVFNKKQEGFVRVNIPELMISEILVIK